MYGKTKWTSFEGRFCKKRIKRKCNDISSVNDKEAEDHEEQNERKCELRCLAIWCVAQEFVCFVLFYLFIFLFCFVVFCFLLLTFANTFSSEIFTARPTELFDKIHCKHTTFSKQTHKNFVI